MCGRFTLTLDSDEVREALRLGQVPADWQPRYNVAPSQNVLVVNDPAARDALWMRWGLVPSWAKDPAIGMQMINARAETVMEKPSFRSAFARRRCLILADGFYEWQKAPAGQSGRSRPFYFRLADGAPFAFAGLWEHWQPAAGDALTTCTIITCAANPLVAPVHPRMPVILTGDAAWHWLELDDQAALHSLLQPYPAGQMQALAVNRAVGSPANDSPECLLPE